MSKHSQQLLVEHLQAMRAKLVERATKIEANWHSNYLGLCVANAWALGELINLTAVKEHPVGSAVQSMIEALPEYAAKGTADYMFPVNSEIGSAKAGHERRLEILDGWIADAQRKLRAAVFRNAMTHVIRVGHLRHALGCAARDATGDEYMSGVVYSECMDTLMKYKPRHETKGGVWFEVDDAGKRLRIAILNLCLTDVLRHGE